jgi:AraC-like DNA-binding protein
VRLTDVALDAPYCDHAHMNAEFRALGGVTPRAFLAARHLVGDGSTVSEGPPAA